MGLDVSLEMLGSARRGATVEAQPRSKAARWIAADARRRVFQPAFDLIVAPGDPFSHLTSLEERRRALRAVARQLTPDGLFVLEGLYRRRHEVSSRRRRIRHALGVLHIEEAWFPIGVQELWHARYRYRDQRDDGSVRTQAAAFLARAWSFETLRELFDGCGLRVTALWGDFDRRPFRRGASRIVVTAARLRRPEPRPRGSGLVRSLHL